MARKIVTAREQAEMLTPWRREAALWYSKPGDQTYQVPTSDLLQHRQFNPSPSTPQDMFNTLYRTPWSKDNDAQPYRRSGDTDFHSGGGDEGSRNADDIVDAFESGQGHKLPPVEITTNGVGATLTDGNHRAEVADMMSQPGMSSYIHYNPHGQMDDDDFEAPVDPDTELGKHIQQLVQNHPYEALGDNAPSTRYVFRQHPETGQWQRGRVDHHSPPQFVDNEDYAHQMMQDVPGYKHDGLGIYHTVDWGNGPELTNQRHLHARRTAMAEYDEYAGNHKAPGPNTGWPAWDMAGEHGTTTDEYGGVPADWYTHPHYYAAGETSKADLRNTQKVYNDMRGKPDQMVNIYRALPRQHATDFNTGDWITTSPEYAQQHADSQGDGTWSVMQAQVPAKHLYHNGDSYYEMGYHGPKTPGQVHGLHEAGFHSDLQEYRAERERQERALEETTGNYGGDVADYFARGGQPLITYKDWMKGKKGQGDATPMDPNFTYTPEPGHDYEPPW